MKNGKQEPIELEPVMLQWCYSFYFLKSFVVEIEKSPNRTLGDFYQEWHTKCRFENDRVYPLANTMGVYLGGLYVLLVCAKSDDRNLIPELPFENLSPIMWGVSEVRCWGNTNKNLRDYIRRLRNSISHSCITIEENEVERRIVFRDENKRGENDKFEVAYSPEEMDKFIFKLTHCIMFKQWDDGTKTA